MTRSTATALVGAVALLACLARFVHLNADPSIATWVGYVVDEGRWNETARNMALFGTAEGSPYARLHLLLTPAYQFTNSLVFRAFGVDFWSARLLSAISGSLIVLLAYVALRRHVTPLALMTGVIVLGFEPSLLMESRMALPELPSVAATLVAFLVLVLARKTRTNALMAGATAALAVAMKATTIMVVPVFPLIILMLETDDPMRARVGRALAFVAGFALLAVLGLGAAFATGILKPGGIVYAANHVLDFLVMTTPYVGVVRYFEATDLEARNLMLLGMWFGAWAWLVRRQPASAWANHLYLASAAWAGWWLAAWSASLYLPGRYVVHFIVPAAVNIMAGLSEWDVDTPRRIEAHLARREGPMRIAAIAWLVLPSAILIATALSGLLEVTAAEGLRLALRLIAVVMVTAILTAIASLARLTQSSITTLLVAPILAACAWLALREGRLVHQLWHFDAAGNLVTWMAALAIVFVGCVYVARQGARATIFHGGVVVVVAIAGALLCQTLPALLSPTYSIRDASRDIEHRLAGAHAVRAFSAESLFLANDLPFRAVQPDEPFDVLVLFEHGAQSTNLLKSERLGALDRVVTYSIESSPRYEMDGGRFGPLSIGVYVPHKAP